MEVTTLNPDRYKDLKTEELFTKIDKFFGKDYDNEVMLLMGSAGSGKSIALQLKFMEAVAQWKQGDPLPIYFNLASNIEIEAVIKNFNSTLGTNLKLGNLEGAHLYIDSFDEGIDIELKRDSLIKGYLQQVSKAKILVSCRTEYLPSDNDHSWFMPESKKLDAMFVAPINYGGKEMLEESIKKYITWAKNKAKEGATKTESYDSEKQYLEKID
jgi:hypothetical protein